MPYRVQSTPKSDFAKLLPAQAGHRNTCAHDLGVAGISLASHPLPVKEGGPTSTTRRWESHAAGSRFRSLVGL